MLYYFIKLQGGSMSKPISENKRNMILNGSLSQAILMLAVPVMINSFIQSMYNLTDTFWLGRIGTENQSAITLVSPFQNILTSFGNGITTAGAILISQYLGARKDEQAAKMANHICLISLGFSIICALLCFLISPSLVTWLGAVGNVYVYGLTYLRIVVLDLPFLFMINLFTAVKQAHCKTYASKPAWYRDQSHIRSTFPHRISLGDRRRGICNTYRKNSMCPDWFYHTYKTRAVDKNFF
jgi:Na+-driven multidrug efflux pump